MKQTTRWSPDTCGCVLEYEWDDAQDENVRSHSFLAVIAKCPAHESLSGVALYNQVLNENQRKNRVFAKAQETNPSITLDDYVWSFNKSRTLEVSFLGKMTGAQKKDLQSECDRLHGANKVRVV